MLFYCKCFYTSIVPLFFYTILGAFGASAQVTSIDTVAAATTISTGDFPSYFRPPLDIPISLSGNYGEFRSNHFHTGYDMRIGGVVGAKLFAVADGFVSRISVSSGGYGNGLYIEHPNGTTSVYGHLLDFAPVIQEYVKEEQYKQQSFSVDLTPSPELFPVKKGEFVGRAGNSGSSGGPHLHFEIRNTATQTTLNYGAYGLYRVTDRTPPTLTRLLFYRFSLRSGVPHTALIKAADLRATSAVIPVSDTFYVAMSAYDRMEGSNAFLSLSKYEIYLDDSMVYTFSKQDVPANHGRYLNSYLQYDRRVELDQTLLKTWVEPGNVLQHFVESPSRGIFMLSDSLVHQLKVVLTDDYGNASTHRFKVVRAEPVEQAPHPPAGKALLWVMDNYYQADGLHLYLPFGALGKNIDFTVERYDPPASSEKDFYAPIWRVGSPTEPLFKPMRISIYALVPETFKEKAIVVSVSKNGNYYGAGGRWQGDYLETHTYNFGDYSVTLDTIPPKITPRFNAGADLRNVQRVTFRIEDDLSGIKSYEGYIDGEWALFVYDTKYHSLSYTFDKKRIGSGKKHTLELKVTDYCNNVSIYNTQFTW